MRNLLDPLRDMVGGLLLLLMMLGLGLLGLVHDLVLELFESLLEALYLVYGLGPGLIVIFGFFHQLLGLPSLGFY